jgi:hypothetical protein
MTLEGAINFSENDISTIYTMNSPQTGQYCVVIPKNVDGVLSMLVDVSKKSLFDSLINNVITKDELIKKINEEYKYVRDSYSSGILVLTMVDKNLFNSAVNSNDKQKLFDETKKMAGVTSEIFKMLTKSGVDKSRINQKITIIENDDNDVKFVEWLKLQQPNFVEGVNLTKLKEKSDSLNNPFASVNPFTGDTNSMLNSNPSDSIFGPVQGNVENTVSTEGKSNDIFGQNLSNDEQSSANNLQQDNVSLPVMEPKPIQSVSLDNDSNDGNNNLQSVGTGDSLVDDDSSDIDKKSGGFANLLILLVILVVVTVVSIELGKFLYGTFGT